jgi:hypothetical protein
VLPFEGQPVAARTGGNRRQPSAGSPHRVARRRANGRTMT